MVLIVKDKQKYPTVAAWLAAAKAQPGEITYASSGDGSPPHLAGVMFEARTNTKQLHVPYRGGALVNSDTIAGTVEVMFAVVPEAVPHVLSGKLHALGMMSRPTRSPVFPQVPTMAESGIADLNLSAWMALLAPAKILHANIDQLNRAVHIAFETEQTVKLAESSIEVSTSSPEEAQRLITKDIKVHAEHVKAAGLPTQ
jgi:tripartite-type tricarboxylate transporter receptor subunit TctC